MRAQLLAVFLLLGSQGGRDRGEALIESRYQRIRDDHIQAMLALRFGDDAEQDLLRRMMAHGEVARRQVSARLDPVQLTLGERP